MSFPVNQIVLCCFYYRIRRFRQATILKKSIKLRSDGFTFKQFFVAHDRCAMKVGTDGVLLGAWTPLTGVTRVLDIGSGSGLIALMLAQRSAIDVFIDAVELEPNAAKQAEENAQASPWADRIKVYCKDVHQLVKNHLYKYDLIVSNPPYFLPATACRDEIRNVARYTSSLTHDALLDCAEKLIMATGWFCVILPYDAGNKFATLANRRGWFIRKRLDIRDRIGKPLHRMLLALSRQTGHTEHRQFVIRQPNGVYSFEFCQLITEFYLFY